MWREVLRLNEGSKCINRQARVKYEYLLAGIHHERRTQWIEYLSRVARGIFLVHGAPGCGKSEQLACAITLCFAQDLPVMLTAARHEVSDAFLSKVETTVKTIGLSCVIARVFDAAEDKAGMQARFPGQE